MSEIQRHELAQRYETAIARFQEHLTRDEDGTLRLDVDDPRRLDIDPLIFADLRRSLEETNEKIRRGEVDPQKVIDKYIP